MRVLVTGATGFVGQHLVGRLHNEGHELLLLLRASSRLELPEAMSERVSLARVDDTTSSVVAAVSAFRPELAFHLAAKFVAQHKTEDVDDLAQSNLTFGLQLLEALAVSGCDKLVHTGTSWQNFSGDKYDPVCLYAATKEAFETLARYYVAARGLQLTVLKLFDTYGPHDPRAKLLSLLLKIAKSGERLSMSGGEQLIDLVHVNDVVEALIAAGDRLVEGSDEGSTEYAVGAEKRFSLRELAAEVARCTGTPLNIEWGGRPYREREVMVPWSGGRSVPGWRARVSLAQGIAELLGEND